jgi:hypothetical protein
VSAFVGLDEEVSPKRGLGLIEKFVQFSIQTR